MSQVRIKIWLNFYNFYNILLDGFLMKWCLRNKPRNSTVMMYHYPDMRVVLLIGCNKFPREHNQSRTLASDVSSVWNFCICFSDFNLPGIVWWHWEMSGDILGCVLVTSIEGTHLLRDPMLPIFHLFGKRKTKTTRQEWKLWKMKVVQAKVDEIRASVTRKSKIGSHKSACDYSCFDEIRLHIEQQQEGKSKVWKIKFVLKIKKNRQL